MARFRAVLAGVALTVAGALGGVGAVPASAAVPGPGWSISSLAQPTGFSENDSVGCKVKVEIHENGGACDSYLVTVTNTGSMKATGPVTITDTLPTPSVEFVEVSEREVEPSERVYPGFGFEAMNNTQFECTYLEPTVTCEYTGEAPPGDVLMFTVYVKVRASAEQEVHNEVKVKEGGNVVAASPANTLNPAVGAQFGVQDLSMTAYGVNGLLDAQAGDHPYGVTTSFDLNTATNFAGGVGGSTLSPYQPVQAMKNVVVYLPLGLVGDPLVTAERCAESALAGEFGGHSDCPASSQIGTVALAHGGAELLSLPLAPQRGGVYELSALYNMRPEAGYPAELGFDYFQKPVVMYANVVRTREGWMLRVDTPAVPHERAFPGAAFVIDGVSLAIFGNPGEHDGSGSAAFFTNPAACSATGPLKVRVQADSWEEAGRYVEGESTAYPQVEGCDMLQFNPTLRVEPEAAQTQADMPAGYEVELKAPQAPNVFPDLATPDLKNATVALPEGVSLSPSAADGLEGCEAIGPHGINIPTGLNEHGEPLKPDEVGGEGEEIGADGLSRLAPGHCPEKSKIGTVEIETPLLPKPLKGNVYVAQPQCGGAGQSECEAADATNGRLYGLYLEASGSGVIVKLKGKVSANPTTGRLTATFSENPQLPFEDLKLILTGGQRAPLANPPADSPSCGPAGASASSVLEPWGGPTATPSSPAFHLGGCAAVPPFAPGFSAGTVQTLADGFSPFTMTLTRKDGEQNLGGVSLTMPPGVAGMLAKVPLCGEPQANAGTCSEASKIGTVNVAAGAGSEPFWLPGRVYLTGPYNGAPFGLSIVVPAKAGPFNLGDVVERAAINVDPHTAQVTVTASPLQQSRDGVPFRLKELNVTIDREGFMFNPTNCSQMHVTGTISGVMPSTGAPGSSVAVSTPFAVAGCKGLSFKPSFSVLVQAKHSRKNGASLHVVVKSGAGQANIGSVKVNLPKQLPSRLSTLNLACLEKVFAANPATCPAGSKVGSATAYTPVLPVALTGPAYFVSHGGAKFPELVVVLQGDGVTVELAGETFISKAGITSSTFRSVPDVPITRFDLVLPTGAHSALAGNGNFCKGAMYMPTQIKGQNGAVVKQSTKIAVSGCPKPKKGK